MAKKEEVQEDKAEKELKAAKAAVSKARGQSGKYKEALEQIREVTANPVPQVASEVYRIASEALE